MALLEELGCESLISSRVKQGCTHQQIALELQQLNPGVPGLSARSVRRFCCNKNIHRSSQLCADEVDEVVEHAVSQVGPSYGRRTINGLLRANNIIVGEQRVRQSLNTVAPLYVQQRRTHSYHQLNPTPYYAEYFGHKMHVDQNEKLIRFGVTHVAASDGYSSKILGMISMPIKNNLTIYEDLYRSIVIEYGLWDQVRVDCGREFALMLFVQQGLSAYRTNTQRAPYLQTASTMNHRAERHWVEINSRINYPIKRALVNMEQLNLLDMDCPVNKFCVSMMVGKLCEAGIKTHICAWNNHHIPGRGIPNVLSQANNRASQTHYSAVPTLDEAVHTYHASGGCLTPSSSFGCDPLAGYQSLQHERQRLMKENLPTPGNLFSYVVNGIDAPLAQALQFMIEKSFQLQSQI